LAPPPPRAEAFCAIDCRLEAPRLLKACVLPPFLTPSNPLA
jgi:hypothetical protein